MALWQPCPTAGTAWPDPELFLIFKPQCRLVLAVAPGAVLSDVPLKVLPAYLCEQVPTVAVDVLGVEHRGRVLGHGSSRNTGRSDAVRSIPLTA